MYVCNVYMRLVIIICRYMYMPYYLYMYLCVVPFGGEENDMLVQAGTSDLPFNEVHVHVFNH